MAIATKSNKAKPAEIEAGIYATAEEASFAKYGDLLKTIERLNIRVILEEKDKGHKA
ncbi:hypothetical protein [Dyadobacter psychrophilus]|uniref:Uncharacterized protein n=1 Tax=Dyadobacter psychrophilus TaxID=651661 RepID=A0A1T5BVT6_9BACT|nr:hypothetical protein [Dyadobacter psychrophilus]SKB51199.1 hypothetical protein SAMN05660293_00643 [Dyadobacter psychrophilus]